MVVGPTWTHKIWKNYGGYTSENMMHGDNLAIFLRIYPLKMVMFHSYVNVYQRVLYIKESNSQQDLTIANDE